MNWQGRGLPRTLLWHAIVVATILLVPKWLLQLPASRVDVWIGWALAGAYLVAVLLPKSWKLSAEQSRALLALAVGVTLVAGIVALLVIANPKDFSQRMLLGGAAIVAAGIVASVLLVDGPARRPIWAWAAALLLLTPLLVVVPRDSKPKHETGVRTAAVQANDTMLSAEYFFGYFPPTTGATVWGGAIAPDPAGHAYLVARARGDVYRIAWDADGKMRLEDMQVQVPINYAEFEAAIGDRAPTWGFRVADIAVRREGDSTWLYASHHFWLQDQQCFVVRVSRTALSGPAQDHDENRWDSVFESSPCLPIKSGRGPAFGGEQVGGNLEFLDQHRLLLTLGDNKFDGFYLTPDYVTDPAASYGKTVIIDLNTGESTIFTRGHRNPQGLVRGPDDRLWSTEHGPQGGDELNLLSEGGNYGYPYHTYGVEYGSVTWPPAERARDDDGSLPPIFAWVPSTAISDLVIVADPAFVGWSGDLLIGSLKGQALWRVRLDDRRVVFAEPIPIGERIRDIAAGPGEFVMWTDTDTIVRLSPATTLNEGAALFTLRCGGCHDPERNTIGPHLLKVLGRPVASVEDFNYSKSLQQVGGWWTEEQLDAFLADPVSFAPGTSMAIEGIADPEARRQLIEYMKLYE